jgi:hypothetical protein
MGSPGMEEREGRGISLQVFITIIVGIHSFIFLLSKERKRNTRDKKKGKKERKKKWK